MTPVTLRRAEPGELDTVLRLLKEAALWLGEKRIDYWQDWISPPAHFVDWIEQGFSQNQFYMVHDGEEVIGCFRLQWCDPLFWGQRADHAGYVHSFAISRDRAGQGLGKRVLGLIEGRCRQKGKDLLRLDCGVDVVGLRRYYEQYGFKPVGQVAVEGEELVLYEKQI